ncbi:hypothetical protein RRG08_037781 [Elysia crispata]|uniref:Uncharacterized protein n=1 Tax=Elysia crispata TaxID=231223 RepID=A0AAE1BBW7_9GAST|nr:hypothetical protein RRG08_037781 [Elysia crispata]
MKEDFPCHAAQIRTEELDTNGMSLIIFNYVVIKKLDSPRLIVQNIVRPRLDHGSRCLPAKTGSFHQEDSEFTVSAGQPTELLRSGPVLLTTASFRS